MRRRRPGPLRAMLTGIDHVIVAVPDAEAAAVALEDRLGVRVGPGGEHAAFGTHNRLAWWGDSYLELAAPADPRRSAGSWFGAAVLRALAASPGGGPVGAALASDDLAADVAALGWGGPTFSGIAGGSRQRPDGAVVRWRTARPPGEPAGPLLFLIEHDPAAAEWTPAERRARATERHPLGGPLRLASLALAVPDVPRAVMRLRGEFRLSCRPSLAGGGARDASLGGQLLRLFRAVPGGPGAIVGLRGGPAARTLDAFGCRFVVAPAATPV